jgi:glycosyltransferase involved in cell wall biosynthesis
MYSNLLKAETIGDVPPRNERKQVRIFLDRAGHEGAGLSVSASGFARSIQAHEDFYQTLITSNGIGRRDELKEIWGEVEIGEFPSISKRPSSFIRSIALSESNCVDLIHIHGLWTFSSAVVACKTMQEGPQVVISPHGMLDTWALAQSKWKKVMALKTWQGRALKRANCIHVLTEQEVEAVRRLGFKSPLAVIPNGVEESEEHLALCNWRNQLASGARVLLFLGRLHQKKGVEQLLRAFDAALRSQRVSREWTLVVAGWGQPDYENHLRRVAIGLENSSAVKFVGPQFGNDKWRCFRSSDAFILPSFSEGLPMAILEAWECGLPVAMSPECNLPYGFAAGAAVQLTPADHEILTEQIVTFLAQDKAAHCLLGERGRSLVRERFSWLKVGADMAAVYRWLLRKGPKPPVIVD